MKAPKYKFKREDTLEFVGKSRYTKASADLASPSTLQQLLEESDTEFYKEFNLGSFPLNVMFEMRDKFLKWHKSQLERAYQLGREEGLLINKNSK